MKAKRRPTPEPVSRRILGRDIFTTGQLSRMWGIAPRTVSSLIDRGEIRGYKVGWQRRVARADALHYARSRGLPVDGSIRVQVLLTVDCELLSSDPTVEVVRDLSLHSALLAIDPRALRHVVVLDALFGRREVLTAGKAISERLPNTYLIGLTLADEPDHREWVAHGFSETLPRYATQREVGEMVCQAILNGKVATHEERNGHAQ